MPLHPPVRVAQKTATTGTGQLQLLAPAVDFQSFRTVFGTTPVKVAYAVSGAGIWEVGFGLFDGTDRVSRDAVLSGSNGTNPVNLPAGQKDVFAWWAGGGFDRQAAATDNVRPDDWMGVVSLVSTTSFTLPGLASFPYGFECTIRCVQANATIRTTGAETLDGAASLAMRAGDAVTVYRAATQWRAKVHAMGVNRITDIARLAGHVVGELKHLAGGTPLPQGFLPCDGRNVSRATHSALFAAVGTTFGPGDGSSTFGLPDCRGRVLAGADIIFGSASAGRLFGVNAGWWGGETYRTLTVNEMPGHEHAGATDGRGVHIHVGITDAQGSHTHSGSTDVQGHHSHVISVPTGQGVAGGPVASWSGPGTGPVGTTGAGEHGHNFGTNAAGVHAHSITTSESGLHEHVIRTSAAGGNGAFAIVQPTMSVNVVIFSGV